MKRFWFLLVPGILLVGAGVVWTLQGLNVLGGSVMSGSSLWATIGPVTAFVGAVLIVLAVMYRLRGRRRGSSPE